MTHHEYQEQTSRLLDNDLRGEESASLFAHLAACHECREFLHLSLGLRSGMAADTLDVPASADLRLRQRFSSAAVSISMKAEPLWSRHVTMRFPVLAFLLCLIAVGAALILSGQSPFHQPETVYVTRLPVVVITDGSEAVQPKN